LQISGSNITISGSGTIVGDKPRHTGTEGEWGMGVRFNRAVNASVSGLTVKDCWGDCIYVGGNSRDILIENCTLDNGRRQGISVTKADNVTIRRCTISNVGGTAPEYAIDVEPNKGDTVDHVLIDHVVVNNCQGGIMATRSLKQTNEGKPLSWIGSVNVRNCDTSASKKFPALFKGCDSLFVSNCKIVSSNATPAILTKNVNYVSVVENTLVDKSDLLSKAKRSAKKILQRGGVELISIEGAKIKKVNANRIITE
jgi:parallel beta-helix repeat protein